MLQSFRKVGIAEADPACRRDLPDIPEVQGLVVDRQTLRPPDNLVVPQPIFDVVGLVAGEPERRLPVLVEVAPRR
jgi:hypothetical protein